jgi:hypothetical protein
LSNVAHLMEIGIGRVELHVFFRVWDKNESKNQT